MVRSNPQFRGVYTAQYSQYALCHTGLAGDRVHLYTISSNVARLAAPRLHKRARRSERADVCINIKLVVNVSHLIASEASAMDRQWRGAPA